ncbi:MAG: C4-dicarboxylic acid transporter DauA [Byssovorax sp.]
MLRRIKRRYESVTSALPTLQFRFASALRESLREGYTGEKFRSDLLAGLVVGIVALPLSMALAIATGVPPQHGLYTAIIAGGLIALLGGSRTQVSGPTAAFVVVLVPISVRYGVGGLLVATMLAGMLLAFLGIARMGKLIQFIPYPVTTGFTAGIGVVIATLQLKDFLGLKTGPMPEHYLDKVHTLITALPTIHGPDVLIGSITLAVLIVWPRVTGKLPAPLVALVFAAGLSLLLARVVPGFHVDTIGTRFSYVTADGVSHPGIPQLPPLPVLPWSLPGGDGKPLVLSIELIRELLPSAFTIAMLGAIESLLSAVVSDGMAGTKHDPDGELLAQGIGNMVAPFFGGFAATGAIARTATNIRSGGRTPVAAFIHALFVLGAVLVLAPLVAYLPMSALAALLLMVAYNMSEIKHFLHVLRVAPKSDVLVQLACFLLTVIFDMVVAVTGGVLVAALLFMRRMAEISGAKLVTDKHPAIRDPLPRGVVLYEIAGPLFFGAAQAALSTLDSIAGKTKIVILDVESVPAMDATGLVNLESALERLERDKTFVILAGVQPQPAKVLDKAGIKPEDGVLAVCGTVEEAVAMARAIRDAVPPSMMTPMPHPAA